MNNRQEKKRQDGFLIQGSIYAASGIISSIIGLMYRLPLTRIIGDEGNGYYSAAFNIYTIILLLSSYSLPLAVSKMVSARVATGNYKNADRILKASLGYATLAGGLGCAVIFLGADWFAQSFLHIPEAAYPMRALAPTVWIVSYLGVCRGYWQGHSTMVPTALSQIIEQIVNALVSVGAAWMLIRFATDRQYTDRISRAFGAMGGTIGTGSGALAALAVFIILFMMKRKQLKERYKEDTSEHIETFREITKALIMTVVPVILSTAIYNVCSILDNAFFGHSMFALGLQDHTAADYGIYTTKYKILINVPVMVANSVATSLIPALSRANSIGDQKKVHENISSVIRFSMIVAIPSAVGLAVVADPLIPLMFGKSDRAVVMMHAGCAAVVFYSLSTVTNAILQGTSHMRIPVRHALMSVMIHTVILVCLLRVVKLGIFGVVMADMCFALCMCVLNGISLSKLLHHRQEYRRTFLMPLGCALIMGIITWAVKQTVMSSVGSRSLSILISVPSAVMVYAFLLLRSGTITAEELKSFPKGTSLIRAARRFRILR
ncbi:MAG: polysaccharide biosynthesis protein [Stomatobaculum sp.]|nr:polysaccharide biosynthesis protein [Stomatobaculum sp.]